MLEHLESKWASRKLALCCLLEFMVLILLLNNLIGENTFMNLTIFFWTGYLAGNFGEHYLKKK